MPDTAPQVALGYSAVRSVSLARTGLGPAAVELLARGFGGPVPLHTLDLGGLRLPAETKAAVGAAVAAIDLQRLTVDLGFHAGSSGVRVRATGLRAAASLRRPAQAPWL